MQSNAVLEHSDIAPGYDDIWYLSCRKVRKDGCFVNGCFRKEKFIQETAEDDSSIGLIVSGGWGTGRPHHSGDMAEILDIAGVIPSEIDKILCIDSREPVKAILPSEILDNCLVIYDGHGELDSVIDADIIIGESPSKRRYAGWIDDEVFASIRKSMIGITAHPISRLFLTFKYGTCTFNADSMVDGNDQSHALDLFSNGNISISPSDLRGAPASWALYRELFEPIAAARTCDAVLLHQIDDLSELWKRYTKYISSIRCTCEHVMTMPQLLRHMELYGYSSFIDAYFAGVPIDDLFT